MNASIHSTKKLGNNLDLAGLTASGDRARRSVEAEAGRYWVGAAVGAIEAKELRTSFPAMTAL
jgi:hypothetical protein